VLLLDQQPGDRHKREARADNQKKICG